MDHSNQVQTFEKNHAKKLLESYLDETEITEKELDDNSTDKHDKRYHNKLFLTYSFIASPNQIIIIMIIIKEGDHPVIPIPFIIF